MRLVVLLVIYCSVLFGCNNDDLKGFTFGDVKTISGAPVSNAEIHILYVNRESARKMQPSTTINFSLLVASEVSFSTKRFGSNEIIEEFSEVLFRAGNHTITLLDSLYTNGLYEYFLETGAASYQNKIHITRTEEQLKNSFVPLTYTDRSGSFQFQTSILGVGEKIDYTIKAGESASYSIDNEIELIAIKKGEIIARKTMLISNGSENQVSLIVD